MLLSTPFH